MTLSWLLFAWCSLVSAFAANAAESAQKPSAADTVVVVYNERLEESKTVADHYARLRKIPPERIIPLQTTINESVSRTQFRKEIELPLMVALVKRGLFTLQPIRQANPSSNARPRRRVAAASIRYLVLCYGLPLKIQKDARLVEPGSQSLPQHLRGNQAAVDSELALLPVTEVGFRRAGPFANPFYQTRNPNRIHPVRGALMVTRLDGPTPEIAMGLVDKALAAERIGLRGNAYIDTRGLKSGGYKLGDDWLRSAALTCRRAGFNTIVDTKRGLIPKQDALQKAAIYLGWYGKDISGALAQPEVDFVSGAVAYHLHSFSAASLRSKDKRWTGPLLAKGATASMGCVFEPYLENTPDLAVFADRFLGRHATFAEAAYASQAKLSWMTTVIGDPIYRPPMPWQK